jgi:hypothetical protein
MWAWSPAAQDALAGGHTAVFRVDVLHSGKPVYVLEVVGGLVSLDADRAVRANLTCSLVDPTGKLTRGDVDDLLDPYECEIAPHRGVRGAGLDELAPLGVFGLTSRDVSDTPEGLMIRLTGQDRAITYQGPMSSALAISGGTPVEEAIIRLLAARNPGLSMLSMVTGYTCGPLLFAPDVDVWREAQELAVSAGARLFHDRLGRCVLAASGPASSSPVARYAEGGGLLLSLDRSEDSDTIRNVVVAESPNGLVRAVVEDDDPTSPTYARGRYGRRVATISNQHFSSVQQAQQAAAARLAWELGRSETVGFTAVPDPGLDVEDVVTVHRPRAGLDDRGLVVATVDIPLGASEAMRVGCRRSVLAMDGRVLGEAA